MADETAWLIEVQDYTGNGPHWVRQSTTRCYRSEHPHCDSIVNCLHAGRRDRWVKDANDATKYPTKEAAEAGIGALTKFYSPRVKDLFYATEHVFLVAA